MSTPLNLNKKKNLDRRLTDEQRDLVGGNARLAYYVARRAATHMDLDDAAQEAAIGMMDASQRFVDNGKSTFGAFAYLRAYGAVKDAEIRFHQDRSRSERNVPNPYNSLNRDCVITMLVRREWHDRFWKAVNGLNPRSQEIIRGRLAGIEQEEIGKRIGACKSMVSKLEKSAVMAIASQLREREIA